MGRRNTATKRTPWRELGAGALMGVISAAVLFGIAELLAAFFAPAASPLGATGSTFIDFTPKWLKNFAIETFGTNDKFVLLLSMGIAAAVLAAITGIIARRSLRLATGIIFALAVVMGICIVTRALAGPLDLIPLAIGTLAGVLSLRLLAIPARQASPAGSPATTAADAPAPVQDGTARRTFLIRSVGLAGVAVLAGLGTLGGEALSAGRRAARAFRESLTLPAPKIKAPALPAGVQAPVEGLTPFVTPNADFYRIDTALVVPEVDPSNWSLRVHGMVEEEFEITFDELLASELIESHVTLTCVSNTVGGNLAGNAKWLGFPLREVMARAKPLAEADMVLSTSVDGFTASTPLPVLQDDRDAMLAVGMNGEPLPLEHGFPVRMVVPGLYGFVSATKWVVDLEVTTFAQTKAYWSTRGWLERGPIKMSSRIEVPRALGRIPAGTVAIGGSAWAQTKGISKVEIQLDGGQWQEAELATEASVDTWRQWSFLWNDAPAGNHKVRVRAYDADNELQIEDQAPPEPDGSTGWHTINFTVT